MNTRIKMIRETLNLTQDAFGKRIGSARNTIANYETGNRTPSNAVFTSICKEFNVNEDWLRTGEGEMFIELSRKDKIMAWATEALSGESEDYRNRFVDALDALSVDDWEVLANMAETMANRNKKKKD